MKPPKYQIQSMIGVLMVFALCGGALLISLFTELLMLSPIGAWSSFSVWQSLLGGSLDFPNAISLSLTVSALSLELFVIIILGAIAIRRNEAAELDCRIHASRPACARGPLA
ncbi:hypothetical protein KFK14_23810 [Sphingobium phenoxybenzoativorans]|uniref:Uncharacterized protein n=1 Tax=Sphingobium phenoxybenzoativorans TaxID=1592790 RepID=A0A975K6X0_9SPHN|nr:hypothetical protein [Sphingobium phenoxybenzoativorans]QUT05918.1 hypothetical protein KFK14_23810 [Sphingobium phenoxybenzoativorans]